MKEKRLFKVATPIIIELIFLMLYGTVDTLMLSNYSDNAAGSVGIANTLFLLFAIVINVIALGIGAIASQYVGKEEIQNAKDVLKTGFYATLLLSIILWLLLFFLRGPLLRLVGIDRLLFDDAMIYLKWASVSIVFISMRTSLATGYRVFSENKYVMIVMTISNIINVILNYILIYGFWIIPELGVEGAAIGTMISRGIATLIFIIGSYTLLGMKLHKVVLDRIYLKRMVQVGLFGALENTAWNIMQVFIVAIVNQLDVTSVLARTYTLNLLGYIFTFSFALATANSVIIGYYIGENNHEKGYQETFRTLKIALKGVLLVALIMNVLSFILFPIFTTNQDVITLARQMLLMAFFIEIGRTFNLIFISALRTAGDVRYPLVMGMMSMAIMGVGMSYIFAIILGLGLLGVFIGFALDELTRGLLNMLKFKTKAWYQIKLT
jgi:putative MATE family efflux protein